MTQKEIKDLWDVLRFHAHAYPQMECRDGLKLLYQNEFGGGHLISDPQKSLHYLKEELKTVIPTPDAPLFEEIGGGLVRVMLGALPNDYTPEQLNDDFVRSANTHVGELSSFLEKIEVFKKATESCLFGFSVGTFEDTLKAYEKAGYPPLSHSDTYRAHYRPAYRVVSKKHITWQG